MRSMNDNPHTATPVAQAGSVPAATRWRGRALVVLGLLLTIGLLLLMIRLMPPMLNPGKPVDGLTFNGSATMGALVIALVAGLSLFGLGISAADVYLVRDGRVPIAFQVVLGLMVVAAVGVAMVLNRALG